MKWAYSLSSGIEINNINFNNRYNMKKFYLVLFLLVTITAHQAIAQSTFSFSCARDTTITNCSSSCITLKAKIPDIRSSSATYTLNPIIAQAGCYRTYVDPGGPGNPTNIDED